MEDDCALWFHTTKAARMEFLLTSRKSISFQNWLPTPSTFCDKKHREIAFAVGLFMCPLKFLSFWGFATVGTKETLAMPIFFEHQESILAYWKFTVEAWVLQVWPVKNKFIFVVILYDQPDISKNVLITYVLLSVNNSDFSVQSTSICSSLANDDVSSSAISGWVS